MSSEASRRRRGDLAVNGSSWTPESALSSAHERRRADLFWADLQGAALSVPLAGQAAARGPEATDETIDAEGPEEGDRAPFFGDRTGEAWQVIGRPGAWMASLDLRGDDLVVRRRRSLLGGRGFVAVTVDELDAKTIEDARGRLRAGTVVLRRVHAPITEDGSRAAVARGGDAREDDPPGGAPVLIRYGGYLLRRDDDDAAGVWGGRRRRSTDPRPAPGAVGFVRQLQEDLRTLGFALIGAPDGHFGRMTEWALREFQHVAGGPWVAVEQAPNAAAPARYVDRLSAAQIPPTAQMPPTVCGWLSADDRVRIEQWLANRWRCPVVIEAWRSEDLDADGQPLPGRAPREENLWLATQPSRKVWRVLARDFSRTYDVAPLGRSADHLRVLGYRETAGKGGPQSIPPNHTWAEAEITPTAVIGRALDALSPPELSTFKVIRAVSETECEGFLDGINAWDNVILSAGPYHWPIGAPTWSGAEPGWEEGGELGGLLAYLRHRYPEAFLRLTQQAMQAEKSWDPTNGTFFNRSQRRYASRLQWRTPAHDGGFATVPLAPEDMSYFKTWRWVYRFQMAARTDPDYRRAIWDYARIRLVDLLATPWGGGLQVGAGAAARPATLGDVFRSERNVAMVLRWHVRFPAHVVSGGRAGATLRDVVAAAGIGTADVSRWGDPEESSLADAIMASPRVPDTMSTVRDWPTWTAARNPRRFALDLSVLPAAERMLRLNRGSFQLNTIAP